MNDKENLNREKVFLFLKEEFDKKYKDILCQSIENNKYHLEGDTYTHSIIVAGQIINDSLLYNDIDFVKLIIVALMHDSGKPIAYFLNNKRHYDGHAGISVFKTIDFLKNIINKLENEFSIILSVQDILDILYIVNYHDIYWKNRVNYLEYDERYYKYIKEFSKYDHFGRITFNKKTFTFPEIEFKTKNKNMIFNNFDRTLYILIGPPASGKDTYLNMQKISKEIIVSRDDILMEYAKEKYNITKYNDAFKTLTIEEHREIDKMLIDKFYTLLNNHNISEIYVNLTNMSIKSRRRWLSGISKKKHNIKIQYIVFLNSFNTLFERNSYRRDKYISSNIIMQFMQRFELPLFSEHELLYDIQYIFENQYITKDNLSEVNENEYIKS